MIAVLAVFAGIVYVNRLAVGSETLTQFMVKFGYSGIFLVSAASGFNILVPIPVIGFFPLFIESGFAAPIRIAIISVGMVVGDVFGYVIGNVGKGIVEERKKQGKIVSRLVEMRDKHKIIPLIILFIYASVVPLPNELIVIPMAFIGYRLRYMVVALFFGNIIFNILAAFGFLSINSIF
ncbi:hypothetical protein C0581_04295 [Candidatus Parcubacteria bacterium]|nr:MAG: hypothetical protein C0581_04295 [Candidatus Parcubacteria bacterium]